ncbi:MAG: hypothetical protein AB8G23_24640 [Myxococcota bacterium]
MTEQEYLYACVEAGVAISGFSALAIALRSRDDREHTAYERTLVASLIERGLLAALFALLPMLVGSFTSTEQAAWSVCSAAIFVYAVSVVVRSVIARREPEARRMVGRRTSLVLFALGTPATFAPILNVLPLGVSQGPHWYLLAVTWVLASSGYIFWFLLRAWVRAA